jgi:hypothetical protein
MADGPADAPDNGSAAHSSSLEPSSSRKRLRPACPTEPPINLSVAERALLDAEATAAAERRRTKLMADAEALRAQAAEVAAAPVVSTAGGYSLQLSSKSSTGYLGVCIYRDNRHPAKIMFKAMTPRNGGPSKSIGLFKTAVEGAVAYARFAAAQQSGRELGEAPPREADGAPEVAVAAVETVNADLSSPLEPEVVHATSMVVSDSVAEQSQGEGVDQREALRQHMREHGLTVPDVLRLCASMMEGS